MEFKPGVSVLNLQQQTILAMHIADEVYHEHGYDFIVTEIWREGGKSSLHPFGYAFDCRIRNIPANKRRSVFNDLVDKLKENWDVVWEETHFHIEYDPRKARR